MADDAKQLIEEAMEATGLTLDQLAERLDYKSLKRAMWGEIPLPESKRRHIADIVRLHQLEHGDITPGNVVFREEPSFTPRGKLQNALHEAGMNPADLAKAMKPRYSIGVVQNVANGTGRMSESMARAIVQVLPSLTVEDLLGGSDSPRIIDPAGRWGNVGDAPSPSVIPGLTERVVPRISWAAAGKISDSTSVDAILRNEFSDEDYDSTGVRTVVKDRQAFAVTISGESMSPEIKAGDYVVVSPNSRPELGKPVVVKTIDGEVLCKRFQTKNGGRTVVLSSIAEGYAEIELPADQIAWIYPVKEHRRLY